MISRHINKDTGIIETTYEGIVTLQEVISYIGELRNTGKYPKKLLILTDAVHGRFMFSEEEDQILAGIVRQYAPSYELIKDAIIIDDPRTTAYSLLYRHAASSIPNYRFEIFSTREAAIKWLLM